MTGINYRLLHPTNIYHISVDALISMSNLNPVFKNVLSTYALSYFIFLLQTFQVSTPFVTTSTEPVASPILSYTTADTLYANIF